MALESRKIAQKGLGTGNIIDWFWFGFWIKKNLFEKSKYKTKTILIYLLETLFTRMKNQIKAKQLIYGKTDKSYKPFLVTEEEYLEIAKPHVDKDNTISLAEVKKKENILNCHTFQISRVFGVCDGQNCSRRLKSAFLN